jgi:serine/threonine protein phosphatase PrpC
VCIWYKHATVSQFIWEESHEFAIASREEYTQCQEVAMRITGAGWTDIGLQRDTNEDSFAVVQEGKEVERQGACYVVCDGLGGAQAGEVASRTAVEAFVAAWCSRELSAEDTKQRLRLAVHEANAVVYRLSLSSEDLAGMGTTLVGFVPHAERAYICNVGDSRCYRLRGDVLTQLTEDHTMAADMIRQGVLDPAFARNVSERNILTRALGTAARVEVDVVSDELRAGDRYLLCSDGLWGTISESDLKTGLTGGSPEETAHRLVDLANACGGPDNSTAIVVDVEETAGLVD